MKTHLINDTRANIASFLPENRRSPHKWDTTVLWGVLNCADSPGLRGELNKGAILVDLHEVLSLRICRDVPDEEGWVFFEI